jgi:hypothetical protein
VTRRCAVLLWAGAAPSEAAPPGIDPVAYARAMFEDVADMVHGMAGVDSLVLSPPGECAAVRPLLWPDVPVVEVAQPGIGAAAAVAVTRGYDHLGVVVADVPDLPQLVLAKLFQALSRSPVAVGATAPGAPVAVGVRLPAPPWLPPVDLDGPDAVAAIRAAAPDPAQVELTPGWPRLRTPADVHRLDPGLEGWESTRALLTGIEPPRGLRPPQGA